MSPLASFVGNLRAAVAGISRSARAGLWRRRERNLRLCETLSLGNRGFLAVVRYQEQQFLVGGTNASIALLAQLATPVPAEKHPADRDAAT